MTTVAEGVLVEKPRVSSIDLLRGIVMVIMAIDHTRDFYHLDNLYFDPTDLTKTNPALFFTRWITHYCAPTFVMLSGAAIAISSQRKTKNEMSRFLLTRGLWLIFLEVVVVRFALTFNFIFDGLLFQVIWAIGASMVIMSALIRLPARAIWIGGLAIVFIHNLLDLIPITTEQGAWYVIWGFLNKTFFFFEGSPTVMVPYPVLPWMGIMMCGFGVGLMFRSSFDAAKRKKYLFYIGATAVLLFIALRFTNAFGDPGNPWSVQKDSLFTLFSFINVSKYPPSLLYTLMTLGPALMILSWMENANLTVLKPLNVFGRVPLFYYILHFMLIHASAILIYALANHVPFSNLTFRFTDDLGVPAEGRYNLPGVYLAWFCIVLFLYPLCVWYNRYKSTHSYWWLSYL
jgi:uncharacterized membrane protein